jgi:hypothetical protein
MAITVAAYPTPGGVQQPKELLLINLPAIPNQDTLAHEQAMPEVPIVKAKSTVNLKMDNMIVATMMCTIQMTNLNDPRSRCYETATSYTC